jgi:glutamyl-tRNA reductase
MRIGVVGINHKLADLKLREDLAKACQKCFGPFQAIQQEHSFILLSTCNRTEVYFSSGDLAATHSYLLMILREEVKGEFDHKLYSYFGVDCFTHLTRVALGLDSAIIGETEIQGQVKTAYEATTEYHPLPEELHFLFQKALGISKRLRSELQLGRGMPNLEHAVFQTGKHFFNHRPEDASILFVGASEINRKILAFLRSKRYCRITLCNRSDEQSAALAGLYGWNHLSWQDLPAWNRYDWIIVGTKSQEYLLAPHNSCQARTGPKLIIDLSVPRNVDPKLGLDPLVTLLNIDQINRQLDMRARRMNRVLGEAEEKVFEASRYQAARYSARAQAKISLLAVTA